MLLNNSWKKEVQDRIVEMGVKQAIANADFNAFYHKVEASLTEAHARTAELTAIGGKGKGSKWELSRPNDIGPSYFGGKEEDWAKWKEELEDYADAVHGGLQYALSITLKISEEVTEDFLKQVGGLGENRVEQV